MKLSYSWITSSGSNSKNNICSPVWWFMANRLAEKTIYVAMSRVELPAKFKVAAMDDYGKNIIFRDVLI